jgi:hypothetical protein
MAANGFASTDLEQQHSAFKTELRQLMRRAYLTPAEQERAQLLKKLKLQTKDRLVQIKLRELG